MTLTSLSIALGLLSISPLIFIGSAIWKASRHGAQMAGDDVGTRPRIILSEQTEVHGDTSSWRGE